MPHNPKRDAATAFEGKEGTHKPRKRSRTLKNKTVTLDESEAQPSTASTMKPSHPSSVLPLEDRIEEPEEILPESDPVTEDQEQSLVVSKKPKRRRKKDSNKPQEKSKNKQPLIDFFPEWKLSPGIGGGFINQDPVISPAGDYLILPTKSTIQIYSTSTSLLVRTIQLDDQSVIKNVLINPSNPTRILVFTSRGPIRLYNWTTGHRDYMWNNEAQINRATPFGSVEGVDWACLVVGGDGAGSEIRVVGFDTNNRELYESEAILISEKQLLLEGVVGNGKIITAFAGNRLFVGHSQTTTPNPAKMVYTWHEIQASADIICVDTRYTTFKKNEQRLDIVLGLTSGLIIVHENILHKLKSQSTQDLVDRQLHWHRNAVLTVKWSRDGNYIISGGLETVLVIWQLDTNQRQYLPHLTSPILNLTISADGSSYALRQADNSVMIISTADLMPSTSINGLNAVAEYGPIPAVIHPFRPNQLLLAIPSKTVGSDSEASRCLTFLQTYDIESNLQLGKQALTRNFITAVNTASNGYSPHEPSVHYIKISHDGKWLATVDRWAPDENDREKMYLPDEDVMENIAMLETSLRFWKWNEIGQTWELVTRADDPHGTSGEGVLELVAHPSKNKFATAGADSSIRVWSPKSRVRNGVPVKDQSGQQLYNWSCQNTIRCGRDEGIGYENVAVDASLAYSQDGSILAASWRYPMSDTQQVCLVDPDHGKVYMTRTDLATIGETKLAFLRQYLIVLSSRLRVFDVVRAQTIADISLQTRTPAGSLHLTVNEHDETFACGFGRSAHLQANNLNLYSLGNLRDGPKFQKKIPDRIGVILANPSGPGYVVVDGFSRIQHLKPNSTYQQTVKHTAVESGDVKKGLDSIFGRVDRLIEPAEPGNIVGDRVGLGSQNRIVTMGETTRQETLAQIVTAASTTSAPSVKDLFERVSRFLVGASVA